MFLSYKVPLQPTTVQLLELTRYAGTSRKIWNWGLSETRKALDCKEKFPSGFDLSKRITQMKKTPEWEWLNTVSRGVCSTALANLDRAWKDCFNKKSAKKRPRFKSSYSQNQSFGLNSPSEFSSTHVRLPKIGKIKLGRCGYVPVGRYSTASVVSKNGKWFVAVRAEVTIENSTDRPQVGVDVGVVNLITTSCGVAVKNPRTLKKHSKKLKQLQKAVSRKKKGSKNRSKAKRALSRKHAKVANIRSTNLHRISKVLTKEHSLVAIEDLRVSQMTRKGKKQRKRSLNTSVLDASFSELRRQLTYKGILYGCKIVAVDPRYTSQMCSCCGFISKQNRRTQSSFICLQCSFSSNADVNAAVNILKRSVARGDQETLNACGSENKTASAKKRRSETKQERNLDILDFNV